MPHLGKNISFYLSWIFYDATAGDVWLKLKLAPIPAWLLCIFYIIIKTTQYSYKAPIKMLEYEFHCKVLTSGTFFNTIVGNDNAIYVSMWKIVEKLGIHIIIFTKLFANSAIECCRSWFLLFSFYRAKHIANTMKPSVYESMIHFDNRIKL